MRDFKNVRVEVVHRSGDKDWEGTGRYLSIRAYKNATNTGVPHMGPDIPITSELSDAEIERLTIAMLDAATKK
jgi:hypothetical protein